MKIATFDIESNNWIDSKAVGFFDGSRYEVFISKTKWNECINQFLDFISKTQRYKGYRIYAHNLGGFDGLFLLEMFEERGWSYELIETNGNLISIRVYTGSFGFSFCDSLPLLKDSLDKLTHAFNVKHKKKILDVSKGFEVNKKSLEYLEYDCKGLYEVLVKFMEMLSIDERELKLTIASQALNEFKKMQPEESKLFTLNEHYEKDIRENFYSGGRVEVYKCKGKNLNLYDVNSLYPSVMINAMPTGKEHKTNVFKNGKIGFYCIEVLKMPEFYISPLLYKSTILKKNFFVIGKGLYYVSSTTLEYLDFLGLKFKIKYGYYWEDSDFIFNEYIEKFFSLKLQGGTIGLIAKYLLNALYGKFAQKRIYENIATFSNSLFFSDKKYSEFEPELGLNLVKIQTESNGKFILPHLSAYITDLARLKHFQLMNEQPESIYYCDTDSIFSDTHYFDKHSSKKLGDLGYKGKYNGIFLGNKLYGLKNKNEDIVTCKGFNKKDFTYNHFEDALKEMQAGNYEGCLSSNREMMLKFHSAIRRKNNIKRRNGKYLVLVDVEKEVSDIYDKRKLIPSKKYVFDTLPFTQEEIKEKERSFQND